MKKVITALLGEDPTDTELEQLIMAMDADGNGKISLDEFVSAMSGWFSDEYKNRGNKKRKLDHTEERIEVHQKIKGFFTQFRKGQQFDIVRSRISANGSTDFQHTEIDALTYVYGGSAIMTSTAKLEFLNEFRTNLANFHNIVARIESSFDETKNAEVLGKMLSVVEIFSSPRERRLVADDIVILFEKIVRSNIVQFFARVLSLGRQPNTVYHVLKAISYFAHGPCIALAPADSIIHPSTMFFKNILISHGIPSLLANHIQSSQIDIKEAAVVAMGNLAQNSPDVRDYLLENNVLGILIPLVVPSNPVTLIRKVIYTISMCCGVTHPLNRLPQFHQIQPCFVPLASVIYGDDEDSLFYALNTFTIILPGTRSDLKFATRIIEMLTHNSPRIVKQALLTIEGVARFDSIQTNSFISCNLLEALKPLLNDQDSSLRIAACECVSTLANYRDQTQALLESGIVDIIINNIKSDEAARWKLVQVLKYLTTGYIGQVAYLVSKNAIFTLCNCFSYFREYDKVLTETYRFVGPSYNFEFLEDIVVALDNIVNVGTVQRSENGLNLFALSFDLGCIDKMRQMLLVVKSSQSTSLKAWRESKGDDMSLKEKVKLLLNKIGHEHALNESTDKVSATICTIISDINQTVFEGEEFALERRVLVKCHLGDEIRAMEIPRKSTFDDLRNIIFHRFDIICTISYKDREGDMIKLDAYSFEKALEDYDKAANNQALRLYLTLERPEATQSYSTPQGSPSSFKVEFAEGWSSDSPRGNRKRERGNEPINHQPLDFGGDTPKQIAFTSNILFPFSQNINVEKSADEMLVELDSLKKQQRQMMFQQLQSEHQFGNEELEHLYTQWFKDAENGQITKEMFIQGMNKFGITDPLMIEQNFAAFDQNRDGLIDFREFVVSLSTLLKGSAEEKLKFMFKYYDLDGSGTLSPDEVYYIFKTSALTQGVQVSDDEIQQAVVQCFKEIDVDGDGQLTFEEFKSAIENQKLLVNCLVHYQ